MKSDGDFVQRFGVYLIAAITWVVLNVAIELMGDQANDSPIGKAVGPWLWTAAVFGVPTMLVVLLAVRAIRRKSSPHVEGPGVDKSAVEPPQVRLWSGPSGLYGRRSEVAQAVRMVEDHSVVVITGPHGIGTSTVANGVVTTLIGEDRAGAVWFDMRSRSSQRPDDARATAGRVLAPFNLDEPADDSARVLANAAGRLIALFERDHRILVLDNVSTPEQVG
ncbi:MAG: ATP-binding protein, partial [Actinomycetota bacterium]|nr:ATP-binding protein [Actinomycetota bacterium]